MKEILVHAYLMTLPQVLLQMLLMGFLIINVNKFLLYLYFLDMILLFA